MKLPIQSFWELRNTRETQKVPKCILGETCRRCKTLPDLDVRWQYGSANTVKSLLLILFENDENDVCVRKRRGYFFYSEVRKDSQVSFMTTRGIECVVICIFWHQPCNSFHQWRMEWPFSCPDSWTSQAEIPPFRNEKYQRAYEDWEENMELIQMGTFQWQAS